MTYTPLPLVLASAVKASEVLRTAGWMSPFRAFFIFSSEKTIRAICARSSLPSGRTMSFPKRAMVSS